GAGGKGVWGAPGSELLEEYVEDANDPNYDSEAVINGDVEFKQVIVEADPEEIAATPYGKPGLPPDQIIITQIAPAGDRTGDLPLKTSPLTAAPRG
ncbi:jg19909, partial [Pararge aegeria aegeria]